MGLRAQALEPAGVAQSCVPLMPGCVSLVRLLNLMKGRSPRL